MLPKPFFLTAFNSDNLAKFSDAERAFRVSRVSEDILIFPRILQK